MLGHVLIGDGMACICGLMLCGVLSANRKELIENITITIFVCYLLAWGTMIIFEYKTIAIIMIIPIIICIGYQFHLISRR